MRYFGGKARISKDLSLFLNNQLKTNQPFVDLFCGSCNIISKIDSNRLRIANDKHFYLIEMWKHLKKGWEPPKNLNKEQYISIKNNKDLIPHLTGFVGFGCSFSGKWFGGYAKDNNDKNYCNEGHNSVLNKLNTLKDVKFQNKDYKDVFIPFNSLVYCDIPYKDTTSYNKKEVGIFDHEEFYRWMLNKSKKGIKIFVSEYKQNVPYQFKIVWEKQSKQDILNKKGEKTKTTEVLFTI